MAELATQYNQFADDFSKSHDVGENSKRFNRKLFYSYIDFLKPGGMMMYLVTHPFRQYFEKRKKRQIILNRKLSTRIF